MSEPVSSATMSRTCPSCGASNAGDAQFCEACGASFDAAAAPTATAAPVVSAPGQVPAGPDAAATATPVPPVVGEESPLDIGWTGVLPGGGTNPYEGGAEALCPSCGKGHFVDGYCDNCGSKEADPRDHFEENPAPWVSGVCDIGRRHTRNEDGMALAAEAAPGTRAVLVVCDGVSNTTDSHIASLAAARAAKAILEPPLSAGVGTPETAKAAAAKRFADAVTAANQKVIDTLVDKADPAPPSCTFVAAVIEGTQIWVGNVGDSRSYWLPDEGSAEQLTRDDSYAAERIAEGVARKEAETGPMAHSITRWLGIDAPPDLTPHTRELTATGPGWLLVCSDGLWNYESEAAGLQELVARFVNEGKSEPSALAGALVEFANDAGGVDNITVALARIDTAGPTHQEEG